LTGYRGYVSGNLSRSLGWRQLPERRVGGI
jgi:hypothetical protein